MADFDTVQDPVGAEGAPGYTPPSDCGRELDIDPLWLAAKVDIIDVHEPEKGKFKYVILGGDSIGTTGRYNLLLVPKERITGIECAKILQSDPHALNVWKYGWEDATKAFSKNPPDILLGINSFDGRTRNQLHIHLTALKRDLRPLLDKLNPKNYSDLSKWNGNLIELGPSLNGKTYVYRIAHVDSLNTNPFDLLDNYVAKKYNDRFAQSLAVVACRTGGYYLLATQGQPSQKGQPVHSPDLALNGHYGTTTAEGLMDRDWK